MRHTSSDMDIDHVALAILRRDDSIVLVEQRAPDDNGWHWVLPGGLVEPGELIVDALAREVREEAGVQVGPTAWLACLSQIDRLAERVHILMYIFEIEQWHGEPASADPDGEVLRAELVPIGEAIARLAANGAWPGIQGPLLAYLRGEVPAGRLWFFREDAAGQHLVAWLGA